MILELRDYLKKILPSVDWTLERTADDKFGDFASNIAFKLSKERKASPFVVAQGLAEEVVKNDSEKIFTRVEAALPGFVNFWVREDFFLKKLELISGDATSKKQTILGSRISGKDGERKKINLEFVSANPTGPLTMANGRGGFLGDVLGNVLEAAGYEVTREYYINDAGVQIKKLGESVLAALGMVPKSEEHYQGGYIKELAEKMREKIARKHKSTKAQKQIEIASSPEAPRNDGSLEQIEIASSPEDPRNDGSLEQIEIASSPEAPRNDGSLEQIEIASSPEAPRNDRDFAEKIGRLAAAELLKQIKKSIKNVGIKYDKWFSEYKDLRKKGELDKTLAFLRERGMVYEREGAVWLRTSQEAQEHKSTKAQKQIEIASSPEAPRNDGSLEQIEIASGTRNDAGRGDDKDRVLIKSDGEATYFLADLAYHYDKFLVRKFDQAIVIWGADHHGYVGRVKSGIEAMGIDPHNFQALIVQLIRLVRSGKEVKMSKRKGDFITLDDLVKDVGRDAARFFFLLHTPTTHMDFDLDAAKERSVKNPVYYLQYAAVRAGSILKKVKDVSKKFNLKDLKIENGAQERLVKALVQMPDIILETAGDLEVSRITRYATELARHFHNFYEKERVIGGDGKPVPNKLVLVLASRAIFEKLFKILGISIPRKM